MYSYQKLYEILKNKKMNKSDLTNILNISSRTIAKMNKGEKISDIVLNKIATYLNCNKDDLYKYVYDNLILQTLKDEKDNKISGGLYHELQVRMTYNSNHIEGSKLSIDQTRMIFETRTLDAQEGVLVDDIIEASNHFRAIDYAIDVANEQLSEDIIKHFHYILKQNTKNADIPYFKVGDYKIKPNFIGGIETASPNKVPLEMKRLIDAYNLKQNKKIEDIIDFHVKFERIHPFQDGNGRVGRLIMLKECFKNNIVPFIIEDSKKAFYYRGLKEYDNEKGYLVDTCLDGQDTFKVLLEKLDIKY